MIVWDGVQSSGVQQHGGKNQPKFCIEQISWLLKHVLGIDFPIKKSKLVFQGKMEILWNMKMNVMCAMAIEHTRKAKYVDR